MNTKVIRIIERGIYNWSEVRRKDENGTRKYYTKFKQFDFITGDSLVLNRITPEERQQLSERWEAKPYSIYNKTVGFYLQIPMNPENANQLLPYIRSSYEHALKWKGV